MGIDLRLQRFADVNVDDPFFDSLKNDYREFVHWFEKKGREGACAYTLYDEGVLSGFMYLKIEEEAVGDVHPALPYARRVKLGTLKINGHGSRLGERFIKKALDHAIDSEASDIYVTVFDKHLPLIRLLFEFGFGQYGQKKTENGIEIVMLKSLYPKITGNVRRDYPLIDTRDRQKFLLAIKPEWHTQLFPDSILNNESFDIVQDVSHTNSIQKTYICSMDLGFVRPGDIAVIYRTTDIEGRARYRAVATSVCTVEDIRDKRQFAGEDDFVDFTLPFSVFDEGYIRSLWRNNGRLYALKMLYNAAFSRRLTRGLLIDEVGLNKEAYWGCMRLSDSQFFNVLERGGVSGRLVIH